MQLVDAHCHLQSDDFGRPIEDILDEAAGAGVVKLVTAAASPEDWGACRALAEQHDAIECALGIHPWYVEPEHRDALGPLGDARACGAKAIGEIGLDRKVDSPPLVLQMDLFRAQLEIAIEIDLPIVVHCRGAFNDLFEIVRRMGLPRRGGMIHAFSGSIEVANECVALGFACSLGGTLTYRNSRKRERVLRRIFPDHFLLETDSPDMPPVGLTGAPNVPANITRNLRAAAEILGVSEEVVAARTTANAARLFDLEL